MPLTAAQTEARKRQTATTLEARMREFVRSYLRLQADVREATSEGFFAALPADNSDPVHTGDLSPTALEMQEVRNTVLDFDALFLETGTTARTPTQRKAVLGRWGLD